MPTTHKASIQEAHENDKKNVDVQEEPEAGQKRHAEEVTKEMDELLTKRMKTDDEPKEKKEFKPHTGMRMNNPFRVARNISSHDRNSRARPRLLLLPTQSSNGRSLLSRRCEELSHGSCSASSGIQCPYQKAR
jgi:hypothetical protein